MPSSAASTRLTRVLGLVAVSALTLSGCGVLGGDQEPERDEDGRLVEEVENGDVFDIQVGDCIGSGSDTGNISEVTIVPCDEPHASEAFYSFDIEGDTLPDEEAMLKEAERCQVEFETFVGVPAGESSLQINYYSPTEESWNELDDREILCFVYDPAGQTTGTLKNSAK